MGHEIFFKPNDKSEGLINNIPKKRGPVTKTPPCTKNEVCH